MTTQKWKGEETKRKEQKNQTPQYIIQDIDQRSKSTPMQSKFRQTNRADWACQRGTVFIRRKEENEVRTW